MYPHELFIVQLYPTISTVSTESFSLGVTLGSTNGAYRWKASVSVFTTTHALTKRSKVIPGGGPYPGEGSEARIEPDKDFLAMGSDASLPYLCSIRVSRVGDKRYPKLCNASDNSRPSIEPERSRSKCRKTFCQSEIYLHKPVNSKHPGEERVYDWLRSVPVKLIVPVRSVSYAS